MVEAATAPAGSSGSSSGGGGDPAGFDAALADAHGQCTIEARFKSIGPGYYHAYLVTHHADGTSTYYRGGPSEDGPSSGSSGMLSSGLGGSSSHSLSDSSQSGGSHSSDSSNSSSPGAGRGGPGLENGPWGPIETEYGPYVPGTVDWQTGDVPSVVVARVEPGDCQAVNDNFRRSADAIEAAEIPYNPLGSNSNATVRELLERAGYEIDPPVWVPGWSTQLP